MFQDDAGVNGAFVKVVQLLNLRDEMIFNRLGQRDTMGNKNQFHYPMMLRADGKIQPKVLGAR
jgi:hypothetical protein